jgi:hypothetical protein
MTAVLTLRGGTNTSNTPEVAECIAEIYQTIGRDIPGDSGLLTRRREKIRDLTKSNTVTALHILM